MENKVKHPFRIRIDRYVKKAVTSFLSHTDSGVVLDLGCGNAPYAYLFKNFYYVGGDLDRRSRKVSVLCDSHFLPFRSEAFDLILATEILEHVSKPSFVLKECGRVLKFGGHIILTTRFMFPYHPEPTDYYRFTKESLTQLFEESGFTILRLLEEGGLLLLMANIFSYYSGGLPTPIKEVFKLIAMILDLIDRYVGIGKEYSPGYYVHAIKLHNS